MKKTKTFLSVAVAVLLAAFPVSCNKGPELVEDPEGKESVFIQTGVITDIDFQSAVAHAAVKSLDGTKIKAVKFRVCFDEAMTDNFDVIPAKKVMDNEYEAEIGGLSYNCDYYYACCVETEDKGELRGAVRKFTHMDEPVNDAIVETMEAENIERYAATVSGRVLAPKGVTITRVTISYGTNANLSGATHSNKFLSEGSKETEFKWNLNSLKKGTKYYYQVTGHFLNPGDDLESHIDGEIKSFTTAAAVNPVWVLEGMPTPTPVTSITVKTGESVKIVCVNANSMTDEFGGANLTATHGSEIKTLKSGHTITITGVSACTNKTMNISYKIENAQHNWTITYSVVSTDEKRRQNIRDYFFSHQSEETPVNFTISPEPVAKYIVSNNGVMVLDSHRQPVSSDYPEYNYRPVSDDNIYPGSLVYINSNLQNGTPEAVMLPCSNAAGRVNVYVTFLANGKEVSETGVLNTPDAIYTAVNKLVSNALASGSVPAGNARIRSSCSNSSSKLALDFGASASFMKAKCSVETSTSKESTSLFAMHSFTQEFYNVKIAAANNDPTNFLGTGVTADIIRDVEKAGKGKIGIITSVSYGRYGYYTKSYEQSKFSFKGSEKVSYGNVFDVSAKQDISNLAESTDEWGYIYGGNADTMGEALKSESEFKDKVLSNMTVSLNNQGVPMFYTVKYLGSLKDAGTKYTGSYNDITAYKPCPETITVDMYNHIKTSGSKDVKVVLKLPVLKLTGSDVVEQPTPQEFAYWWGGREHTTQLVKAPAGCVFGGIAEILVYTNEKDLKLNGKIDVSDGYLKLCLTGSQGSPSITNEDGDDCDLIIK